MESSFTISFDSTTYVVEPLEVMGTEVYRVKIDQSFVIIAKAERQSGSKFWTSIPEGDQYLADNLGIQIDAHNGNLLF